MTYLMACPNYCYKSVLEPLKCAICKVNIKENTNIHQSGLNFGIVCEKCYEKFSKEDINLKINIFIAYGGYFGKFQSPDISLDYILIDLIEKIGTKEQNINLKEMTIKLIYQLLLYGISPQECIKKLKSIVEG